MRRARHLQSEEAARGRCLVQAPLNQSSSSVVSDLLLSETFWAGVVFYSRLEARWHPFALVETSDWNGAAALALLVGGKEAQGWMSAVRSHNSLPAFGCFPGLLLGEKDCGSVSPLRMVGPGSALRATRRHHGT